MANVQLDSLTDTWNNGATTFNAVKMNVTDTASAAASKLIDLQVGGNTKANVTKAGLLTLASGVTLTGANTIQTTTGALTIASGSSNIILTPTSNVGIGTTGPDRKLDVLDASNPQLRLTQADGTAYAEFQALSTGHLSCVTSGGNRITSTVTNDTSVLARQVQGGLAFDGVTNAKGLFTIADVATSDVTTSVTFLCPSSNPSSPQGVLYLGSSSTTYSSARSLAVYFGTLTAGSLSIELRGATASDTRTLTYSGIIASFGGKVVTATFVRSSSGMTTYFNGVLTTGTETNSGGSAPAWTDTITSTYAVLGQITSAYLFPSTIFSATLFNRALSAAEVVTLANQGVQEADKWGSLTAKYTSNFSATTDGWSGASGVTISSAADPAAGPTNVYKSVATATTGAHKSNKVVSTFASTRKRFKISYEYWIDTTSNPNTKRLGVWVLGNSYLIQNNVTSPTSGAWTSVTTPEFTTDGSSTVYTYLLQLDASSNDTFTATTSDIVYFRNITITQIGSILDADLSAGVGYQVPDRSSNKYHGVVSATGTSWTLANRRGQLRATTDTLGDKQIFSQVSLPTNAIITSIIGYTTGTPTIKIGNVSAGSQLVASVAMSASTYQSFTVAATTSTTGNVWVNSSTADTINWTITYMIADP